MQSYSSKSFTGIASRGLHLNNNSSNPRDWSETCKIPEAAFTTLIISLVTIGFTTVTETGLIPVTAPVRTGTVLPKEPDTDSAVLLKPVLT